MLEHGGRLRQAAANYGIPLADWLDLSTGINPNGWSVPPLPASIWQRLPEDEDGLEQTAQDYYGASAVLPVAGSQAAIAALPRLRTAGVVAILHPGYAEHAHAWRQAGHRVVPVTAKQIDGVLADNADPVQVMVLIHPNNPTGVCFEREQLLGWHQQLANRGGWLVIDEAFMDMTPEQSLVAEHQRPGLILLRSLGKFFGLAGARVGFVAAHEALLAQLKALLGPWTVPAPARWVALKALQDRQWQADTRASLIAAGQRMAHLLTQAGLSPDGGCGLFQWVQTARAEAIQRELAAKGVWLRRFDDPHSVRFGLPGQECDWQRLERSLATLKKGNP